MDMVERVARSLAKLNGKDWDTLPDDVPPWLSHKTTRYDFLQDARDAIEAMREPTDEMKQLVIDLIGADLAAFMWNAMIDAALGKD